MKNPNHIYFRFCLMTLLGAAVVYFLQPFLVALVTGLIFGVVLTPLLHLWNHRMPRFRGKPAFLTLGFAFTFLLPLVLAAYFGINAALEQVKEIRNSDKVSAALAQGNTHQVIESYVNQSPALKKAIQKLPVSKERVLEISEQAINGFGTRVVNAGQEMISGIPFTLFCSLIILATVFFVLKDGKRGRVFLESNPVFGLEQTRKISKAFYEASYSVVVASVISGLTQASILVTGCLVTGKASPILVGLITFCCSFLPVIGTTPVTVTLVGYQFLSGDQTAAFVLLGFGLLASVADNLVVPGIVGERARIHPLIVFVSIFGAIEMIGLYGIFVGPVVTATFLKAVSVLSDPSLVMALPSGTVTSLPVRKSILVNETQVRST